MNALGTLNLLEAARQSCPETPFVHMSTNKVYGDRPNTIALVELDTRWDYADETFAAEEFRRHFRSTSPSIRSSGRQKWLRM